MEKYYRFAGVELAISIPQKWMYNKERNLTDFRVQNVDEPHYFQFETVDELSHPYGKMIASFPDYCVYEFEGEQLRYIGTMENGWESAYIRVIHRNKEHYVQLKNKEFRNGIGTKTILNSLGAEHLVVEANGVILHASFIEWNGKAILFTAPSGTGKSTQADLWTKYRQAEIINGDRAVIRIVDGEVVAVGIPFAGSSKYCKNRTLPLVAIVYLQQAPKTTISQLNGVTAFQKVWEGCTVNTWDKADLTKAIDIVQSIVSRVPVYQLACTPDESAVETLEQALKEVWE